MWHTVCHILYVVELVISKTDPQTRIKTSSLSQTSFNCAYRCIGHLIRRLNPKFPSWKILKNGYLNLTSIHHMRQILIVGTPHWMHEKERPFLSLVHLQCMQNAFVGVDVTLSDIFHRQPLAAVVCKRILSMIYKRSEVRLSARQRTITVLHFQWIHALAGHTANCDYRECTNSN